MSVGVSYRGVDGRKRSAQVSSVDELRLRMGDLASRMQRDNKGIDAALLAAGMGLKKDDYDEPNVKVKDGGSVVKDTEGRLCLRGEDSGVLVPGKKLFAANNGRKGFFRVAEMDPPTEGGIIGKIGNADTTPDAQFKSLESGGGDGSCWGFEISRTAVLDDTENGKVTVKNFYRTIYVSAMGRIIGMSIERELLICEIEYSSGGKHCVKPLFTNGILSKLQFGTAQQLDAGTPASEVETVVGCPYQS